MRLWRAKRCFGERCGRPFTALHNILEHGDRKLQLDSSRTQSNGRTVGSATTLNQLSLLYALPSRVAPVMLPAYCVNGPSPTTRLLSGVMFVMSEEARSSVASAFSSIIVGAYTVTEVSIGVCEKLGDCRGKRGIGRVERSTGRHYLGAKQVDRTLVCFQGELTATECRAAIPLALP
jgi:hypothetical protein